MKLLKKLPRYGYYALCSALLLSTSAHAYVDPAATSYIIQIVAGVFIACGAIVGVFWKKITMFFSKKKTSSLEKKLNKQAAKKEKRDAAND